ncbi:MAG: alanine racemase [Chthoniobacterales bacterium]
MTTSYRCWAEIEAEALHHNTRALRSFLPPGVLVVGVVKADAYGHGLSEIARLIDEDVDLFGVANVSEGLEIRRGGARSPVLLLGPALPSERAVVVKEQFIPPISTAEEASTYAEAVPDNRTLPIHFVIDTGMGRIGLWGDEARTTLKSIRQLRQLSIAAVSSHLPVADEDLVYTAEQFQRFKREAAMLFPDDVPATILNSAGVLHFGREVRTGDLVRVGLALYGISPLPEFQHCFLPALTWKTRVTLVRMLGPGRSVSYGRTFITPREMRIATLAAGYGDGYQRHLRDAEVLIRGNRCRVLGRVTMDQILVDVSALDHVEIGEEVVLIGKQGNEQILATEVAERAGTIAWEIFTGITKRVVRVYR